MNENKYKKRCELQQKLILRQSEKIAALENDNEKLKNEIKARDAVIASVTPLQNELTMHVDEAKKYKEEYKKLVQELKQMKNIVNQSVYKGRWWLIRLLIK